MKYVYADNAATTRIRKEALNEMMPYLSEEYGNPSSLYDLGKTAKQAIETARKRVAGLIGAEPSEIFFTSGGTESDNWAVKSAAHLRGNKGKHLITTKIEHPAVLNSFKELEKEGFEVSYLDVEENGILSVEGLKQAIREDTILISVMFANNEIGTLQPIKEIGRLASDKGILFHTDAVQAAGHVKIDVKDIKADLLSISGHKLYSPKGIGALYIKKGLRLPSLINGGGHEQGRRAGTENVASIAAFGKSAELAALELEKESVHLQNMRDRLVKFVLDNIPYSRLNGDKVKRLPGNANFSIEFIEGESLVLMLGLNGVAASSGSACSSGSLDPSHVLTAIGLSHEVAHGSLRFSLGRYNTEDDIDHIIKILPGIVKKLREMSPLWNEN